MLVHKCPKGGRVLFSTSFSTNTVFDFNPSGHNGLASTKSARRVFSLSLSSCLLFFFFLLSSTAAFTVSSASFGKRDPLLNAAPFFQELLLVEFDFLLLLF